MDNCQAGETAARRHDRRGFACERIFVSEQDA